MTFHILNTKILLSPEIQITGAIIAAEITVLL